ncbi:hypothetical protein ACFLWV_01890 [Chloroflexota bacterium]
MGTNNRSLYLKMAVVAMAILLMGSLWLSGRAASEPVNLVVTPIGPKEGEPVIATYNLNNPSSGPLLTNYEFYVNGELLAEGVTTIPAGSGETHQYVYEDGLKAGDSVNFAIRGWSELGTQEKVVSVPPYPPQALSSFVSFAAFSTSIMSSMSSTAYYNDVFSDIEANAGLIATVVLIVLLIFMEMSRHVVQGRSISVMGKLRVRFSALTWILFIVFAGIVYTNIIMVLTA